MRHHRTLLVVALVSGTACRGVRTEAPGARPVTPAATGTAPAPVTAASPPTVSSPADRPVAGTGASAPPAAPRRPTQTRPEWSLDYDTTPVVSTPLTDYCVWHPMAFTRHAQACGFVVGTTRGELVARHNGLDDWSRPLSGFLPDSSDRPMSFALTGAGRRSVSLYIRPDSLGLFGYEGDRHVDWTRFATRRAKLVSIVASDEARDTTHFRMVLDTIEAGIREVGGVLLSCRRVRVPYMDDNQQIIASWRVASDVITLSATLDSMNALDTLSARWSLQRSARSYDVGATIEPGCVTPARADFSAFARAAAIGYATEQRARFRMRRLVQSCEVTRAVGVLDHPRCEGVPSHQEYLEKWPQPQAERRGPPPPWLTSPPTAPVP